MNSNMRSITAVACLLLLWLPTEGVASGIILTRLDTQNVNETVSPGAHLTYFCQTCRTSFQTWRVLSAEDNSVSMTENYFINSPIRDPVQHADFTFCELTDVAVDPIDGRFANFTSLFNVTAAAPLNGIIVQCLGATDSGTVSVEAVLHVSEVGDGAATITACTSFAGLLMSVILTLFMM